MSKRATSRGVVLLSVLLIVALLSAIAIRMTTRHSLTLAQARHSQGSALTLSYAIGAETLARQLLYRDWEEDPEKTDHFGDAWAQPLEPFELEEYEDAFIEMQLRDLSSCFNLNSLAGSDAKQNHQRFKTLLRNLQLPETIADAWLDWVDPDEEVNGFGAEDSDYLLAEVPYRAANQAAADVSELQLLPNMEAEHLARLLPHVCTLPSTTLAINANTATAEVLSSLNPALTLQALEPIVTAERAFQDVNEVTVEVPDLGLVVDALKVYSDYFELRAQVQIDGNLTEISSVIQRNTTTDGALSLIKRDLGKAFVSLYQDENE